MKYMFAVIMMICFTTAEAQNFLGCLNQQSFYGRGNYSGFGYGFNNQNAGIILGSQAINRGADLIGLAIIANANNRSNRCNAPSVIYVQPRQQVCGWVTESYYDAWGNYQTRSVYRCW